MQILYWFENTKEPMPKNSYLNQYVAALPSKLSWFIKRGKDMTSPIGTHPSSVQQFWLFATLSSTNSTLKRFKWFTFLQIHFWAERFSIS